MRYLVVGVGAFLIDIGLLAALHEVFGVPLVVATPAAFLLSFAATYVLQRMLTFDSAAGWVQSAARYTLLVGFNTLATTAIVASFDALGMAWVVGKLVSVASTTVWNYFLYKYWIFASPHGDQPSA